MNEFTRYTRHYVFDLNDVKSKQMIETFNFNVRFQTKHKTYIKHANETLLKCETKIISYEEDSFF